MPSPRRAKLVIETRLSEVPLLCCLFLLLCTGALAHAATVKLAASDGSHVTLFLHVGDRIHLELPAKPSTGYRWSVSPRNMAKLQQVGSTLREDSGLMGGAATQSYTWQVLQPGETDLVLQYDRSFEPTAKPAQTYSMHIAATAYSMPPTSDPAPVLMGSYSGQQPCADCSGIHQELLLYAKAPNEFLNTTYILKRTYQGTRDGDQTMVETGTWLVLRGSHADANATVYQLDGATAGASPQFFEAKPDRLIPLDAQQIPLPGPPGMDLALHKMPVPQ